MGLEFIEAIAGLGVGAVFGVIVFIVYRIDRKASEKRLTNLIDRDQESRESNTRIMAEVFMLLKNMNGKGRHK